MFSQKSKREVILSNSTVVSIEVAKKVLQHVFHHAAFELIDSKIVFHQWPKDVVIKKSLPSKMNRHDLRNIMTGKGFEENNIALRMLESDQKHVFVVNMTSRVRCNSKIASMNIQFTLESKEGTAWDVVAGSSIDMNSVILPWYGAGFFYENGTLTWNKIHGSLDTVRRIAPQMTKQSEY